MDKIGNLITCLFERHKFVRRVSVFWMFALVTHAHWVVYSIIQKGGVVDGQVIAAFGLSVGMVATLTAWYLQVRYHEDKNGLGRP